MDGKIKLGLKSKILFGLAIVLLFSIGFNLYFSYDLFLQDKTSYIFETGLKRGESLSDQFIETIKGVIQKTDLYALIKKTSPDKLQKLIDADPKILMFSKIIGNRYDYSFINYLADKNKSSDGNFARKIEEINLNTILNKLGKEKNGVRIGPTQDLLKHPSVVVYLNNPELGEFLFLIDLSEVTRSISEDNIFENHLLTIKGESYIAGKKKVPRYFPLLFKNDFAKGTKEFLVGSNKFLVSFVKYPEFNFVILSSINKDRALAIAETLIKRSLFFGGALLSICLFIGVFFSSKLTKPLRLLAAGTKEIARGNYDYKVEVKTKDEVSLLARSFNSMGSEIRDLLNQKEVIIGELKKAHLQLEDYSKNLEKMVEKRTEELKEANNFLGAMVNSLDQGLMVFNENSTCHEVHTKACEKIFSTSPVGKKFYEILGMEKEKDIEGFHRWKDILFSEKIPFESAVKLGPQSKEYGSGIDASDYKFVDLEYYPMRNEEDQISNIVAVATDKTDEIRAIEAFKGKEAYVTMVLKIIHGKKQFFSFLDEVEEILQQLEELTAMGEDIDINKALILFHSLNGGFGMYSVQFMQELARKFEGELVQLNEENDEEKKKSYRPKLKENILSYQIAYEEFIKASETIFGKGFRGQGEIIEVDKDIAERIISKIKELRSPELEKLAEDHLGKDPVGNHFSSYIELVATLAEKLNKKIAPLKLHNANLRINSDRYKELFNTMVHLFRNCVDHGIEEEFERVERNKTPEGHISVDFEILNNGGPSMLSITVKDDGGGIDPCMIRKKLAEKDPCKSYDQIPDEDIIYHIFDPTFSTAEEVTSVSGRGVGMSAIKEVVDKMGGNLTVKTKVGEGTCFNFQVPNA